MDQRISFKDFLSTVSLLVPERIVESGWLGHAPFAFWLMEATRPRLTVELGSHWGYALAAFCQAQDKLGVDGRVIGVDSWRGDEHAGQYDDSVFNEVSAYFAAKYSQRCELKRMYFAEALKDIADGSVDVLHVDGRHFYDDVVEDYTTWIPKLSDRAVVLFHDTQVFDRNFGVNRYWRELIERHAHFEFKHSHGLGVLGVGSQTPEAIARLLSPTLPDAVRADVRQAYARLGAGSKPNRRCATLKRKRGRAASPSSGWSRAFVSASVVEPCFQRLNGRG